MSASAAASTPDKKEALLELMKEGAQRVLDEVTEFDGDLNDMLKAIRRDGGDYWEGVTNHEDYSPLIEVPNRDDPDDKSPHRIVKVKFVSGIEGEHNYYQEVTWGQFLRWKGACKKAGFEFSLPM